MAHYFSNFPLIQYSNTLCRSIISRAAISQDAIKNSAVFYPYTNTTNERADTLAFHYYNTSQLDWLVYYANDVVDPYYDWYLTQEQFAAMIADKYQSAYEARLKVHHFQVDWVNDDRQLSISEYEALPSLAPTNVKQYWQPVLNDNGTPIYYVRKPLNTTVSTNKIHRIEVASTVGYENGEIVSQFNGGVLSGYAELVGIEDQALTIKSIVGSISLGNPIVGWSSNTSQLPVTVSSIVQNIPAAEETYWRAISIYDYEDSLNEQRKVLKVVDQRHADAAQNSLSTLFQ